MCPPRGCPDLENRLCNGVLRAKINVVWSSYSKVKYFSSKNYFGNQLF